MISYRTTLEIPECASALSIPYRHYTTRDHLVGSIGHALIHSNLPATMQSTPHPSLSCSTSGPQDEAPQGSNVLRLRRTPVWSERLSPIVAPQQRSVPVPEPQQGAASADATTPCGADEPAWRTSPPPARGRPRPPMHKRARGRRTAAGHETGAAYAGASLPCARQGTAWRERSTEPNGGTFSRKKIRIPRDRKPGASHARPR